jgi:hypothetical protein
MVMDEIPGARHGIKITNYVYSVIIDHLDTPPMVFL